MIATRTPRDGAPAVPHRPTAASSGLPAGTPPLPAEPAPRPVVANPVGVQGQLVRDENGILAATTGQWVEAVQRLAADAEMRRRMGEAGRQQVEAQYSVEAAADLWLAALDRFAVHARLRRAG